LGVIIYLYDGTSTSIDQAIKGFRRAIPDHGINFFNMYVVHAIGHHQ